MSHIVVIGAGQAAVVAGDVIPGLRLVFHRSWIEAIHPFAMFPKRSGEDNDRRRPRGTVEEEEDEEGPEGGPIRSGRGQPHLADSAKSG